LRDIVSDWAYKTYLFLTILKVPKCEFGSVLEFFGRGRRKTNDDGKYKTENDKEAIS
jgi:hypothetical protein